MNNQIYSKAWSIIKIDLKKVWTGFLLAMSGALCAFLGQLSGLIDYSHYGIYAPYIALAVGSICSSLINLIRKYMSATTYAA